MPFLSIPSPPTVLLILTQLSYSVGSFLADFNETHVLNPRWPPHARFHNGQTMSLAVLLASSSLYYLYLSQKSRNQIHSRSQAQSQSQPHSPTNTNTDTKQSPPSASGDRGRTAQLHLNTSVVLGALYPLSGLSAILYPGSDWLDPEFITPQGARRPQLFVFSGMLACVGVGWFWESGRLHVREGTEGKARWRRGERESKKNKAER